MSVVFFGQCCWRRISVSWWPIAFVELSEEWSSQKWVSYHAMRVLLNELSMIWFIDILKIICSDDGCLSTSIISIGIKSNSCWYICCIYLSNLSFFTKFVVNLSHQSNSVWTLQNWLYCLIALLLMLCCGFCDIKYVGQSGIMMYGFGIFMITMPIAFARDFYHLIFAHYTSQDVCKWTWQLWWTSRSYILRPIGKL